MTTLTCPKCAAEMRSYERNRILVDQCTGCGGLFLDRGELESLVAAENAWHQGGASQPQDGRPQVQPQAYAGQSAYDQRPVQSSPQAPYRTQSKPYGQQYGHRKRRSFLSDLFDD